MINFLNINYILSHIRKTVDKYGMIEKGDKIAVGVSGGKDSLTLLTGLYYLSKFMSPNISYNVIFDNSI